MTFAVRGGFAADRFGMMVALGFIFGLALGWIGFIVVCCLPKNEKKG